MSLSGQQISAYAMYKRKTTEQKPDEKPKRQRLSRDTVVSKQNNLVAKKIKGQMTTKKNRIKIKDKPIVGRKYKKSVAIRAVRTTKCKKDKKKDKENVWEVTNIELPLIKDIKQQPIALNNEKNYKVVDHPDFNPLEDSECLFEWLIYPVKAKNFLKDHFEKRPLFIHRKKPSYHSDLVSTPLFDKILRERNVYFTKNIDITCYTDGKRETYNEDGRALPSIVWEYYLQKCSVRMLNPQTFIDEIYMLCGTLQEYFGCFVGCNLYLTPPGSQGFAPHFDDIEAFVLQVEGKKRWRLYKPRDEDYLARFPSKNFDTSELGELILDKTLHAGDLLYFPRGTIHQAETSDDTHSLHLTLSVYQRNSWCDFLERLLPLALKRAAENDCNFRAGLPVDYLRYAGIAHISDMFANAKIRASFTKKIKILINQLMNYIDIDSTADLMAKAHIHDFLPPALTFKEYRCSVIQDGSIMGRDGVVNCCEVIRRNTRIRLTRSHCIRLIKDDDGVHRIYFSTENSKEYHEYELQYLDIDDDSVSAVKEIIRRYPRFIRVKNLPLDNDEYKVELGTRLWEMGLIVTDVSQRDLTSKKDRKNSVTRRK